MMSCEQVAALLYIHRHDGQHLPHLSVPNLLKRLSGARLSRPCPVTDPNIIILHFTLIRQTSLDLILIGRLDLAVTLIPLYVCSEHFSSRLLCHASVLFCSMQQLQCRSMSISSQTTEMETIFANYTTDESTDKIKKKCCAVISTISFTTK